MNAKLWIEVNFLQSTEIIYIRVAWECLGKLDLKKELKKKKGNEETKLEFLYKEW